MGERWPDHAEDRLLVVCGWVVLVVSLVAVPGAFNPYGPVRITVLAGALALGALFAYRAGVVLPRWLLGLGGALVGAGIVAAFAAPVPWESLVGDSERRFGALTIVVLPAAYVVGLGLRRRRALVLRAAPVAVGVIAVAMGVRLPQVGLSGSQTVLVGNAGQLGGLLVLLTGCAVAVGLTDDDRRWQLAGRAAVAVAVAATVLTGSQAAIAGQVVLLVAVLVAARAGERGLPRWALPAAGGVVVTLVGLAVTWSAQFRDLTASVLGRVDVWRVSLVTIAERPLLGWGPDGFRHGFTAVAPEWFVRTYGDDRIQDRAHSLLLDVAGATGLVGLLLFCAAVVALWRRTDTDRLDGRVLRATVLSLGVFLLAWFPPPELAAATLLLLGMAAAADGRPRQLDVRSTRWSVRVVSSVAAVSALLGVMTVVQDHRFRVALDATFAGGDPAVPMELASTAAGGITQQLVALEAARATGGPADLVAAAGAVRSGASGDAWHADVERASTSGALLAAAWERSGQPQLAAEAQAAFTLAVHLAPTHSPSWRGLASLALQLQDPAAVELLTIAAELRPDDLSVAYDRALLAADGGDLDAASAAIAAACELAPDDRRVLAFVARLDELGIDSRCETAPVP